jgi:hypothetical protein
LGSVANRSFGTAVGLLQSHVAHYRVEKMAGALLSGGITVAVWGSQWFRLGTYFG